MLAGLTEIPYLLNVRLMAIKSPTVMHNSPPYSVWSGCVGFQSSRGWMTVHFFKQQAIESSKNPLITPTRTCF